MPGKNTIKALDLARRAYRKVVNSSANSQFCYDFATVRKQEASDLIRQKLLGNEPVMIGRFGSGELGCVVNYLAVRDHSKNYLKYIKGEVKPFWWTEETIRSMCVNAGFFPAKIELLERFAQLMLADMPCLDVLGSWLNDEILFEKELSKAVKVGISDLEPYYHQNPWSEALEGKKVLVVHPFEESVRSQYEKRKLLFKDQRILPDFELKTIKAVQSAAGSRTDFNNWFEALEYLKNKISATDFDIAILGCGAYGFPLAAHIKRMGKKAVHLGGASQILFGIKGKRWEEHGFISSLMNEHWAKPLNSETPEGMKKIEGGCYW